MGQITANQNDLLGQGWMIHVSGGFKSLLDDCNGIFYVDVRLLPPIQPQKSEFIQDKLSEEKVLKYMYFATSKTTVSEIFTVKKKSQLQTQNTVSLQQTVQILRRKSLKMALCDL